MFYLKKLRLNWYGPLAFDGQPDFKPGINLIIGKNGSGKTLTLRMLDNASKGVNISVNQEEVEDIKEEELVKLTFQKSTLDEIDTVTFLKNSSWQNIQVLQGKIRFITSDRSVRGGLSTPNPFRQISDFVVPEPGTEINISDEFNKAIIFELLQRIKELKKSTPDLTKEIEEDYCQGLVDFEKDIKIDFDRDNPVYFMDHKKREVEVINLSAGEKEYLYFYSFLRRIRDDNNKIILIDEPELHLHGNQIRKLCELISKIAKKNQVIIASHSAEILHHFLREANVVLLYKGNLTNIAFSNELKKAIGEIGLPIDPSFFTAHWICAENNPDLPLKGQNAPTTIEVLSWIFGKDISKRFWAFGGTKIKAEAAIDMLQEATISQKSIKMSLILDGDKLAVLYDQFPPAIPDREDAKSVFYFPFWELENIFLTPHILNKIISSKNGKGGFDLFWEKVKENKEILFNSILKTVVKNNTRRYRKDSYFKKEPEKDFENWQKEISELKIDSGNLKRRFDEIIINKNWKWIPGKEAISYVLEMKNNFWQEIYNLVEAKEFVKFINKDSNVEQLSKAITKN